MKAAARAVEMEGGNEEAAGVAAVEAAKMMGVVEKEEIEKVLISAKVAVPSSLSDSRIRNGTSYLSNEYAEPPKVDEDTLAIFRYLDRRSKGFIIAEDLMFPLLRLSPHISRDEANAMILEADESGRPEYEQGRVSWRDFEAYMGRLPIDAKLMEARGLFRLTEFLKILTAELGSIDTMHEQLNPSVNILRGAIRSLYLPAITAKKVQKILKSRALDDCGFEKAIELTDTEGLTYQDFVSVDDAMVKEKHKAYPRMSPLLKMKKLHDQVLRKRFERSESLRKQRVVWHALRALALLIGTQKVRLKATAMLQRCMRGMFGRSIAKKRRAYFRKISQTQQAILLQSVIRMHQSRKRFLVLQRAVFRVAVFWRSSYRKHRLKIAINKMIGKIRAAKKIEGWWRARIWQWTLNALARNATIIQCAWRSHTARQRVALRRIEWIKEQEAIRREKIHRFRFNYACRKLQRQARVMIERRHRARARARWRKVNANMRYVLTYRTEHLLSEVYTIRETARAVSMSSVWAESVKGEGRAEAEMERIKWIQAYDRHSQTTRKLYVMYSTLGVTNLNLES